MGSPTVHGDTIESLIRERRETEEEVRRLQKEIKRLSLERGLRVQLPMRRSSGLPGSGKRSHAN